MILLVMDSQSQDVPVCLFSFFFCWSSPSTIWPVMKSHGRAALRRFVAEHFLPSARIKNTGVLAELILVCKCTPGPEQPPLSTSSDEHGAS